MYIILFLMTLGLLVVCFAIWGHNNFVRIKQIDRSRWKLLLSILGYLKTIYNRNNVHSHYSSIWFGHQNTAFCFFCKGRPSNVSFLPAKATHIHVLWLDYCGFNGMISCILKVIETRDNWMDGGVWTNLQWNPSGRACENCLQPSQPHTHYPELPWLFNVA